MISIKSFKRHSAKVIFLAVVEVKVTLADGGAHRRREFFIAGGSFLPKPHCIGQRHVGGVGVGHMSFQQSD